MNIFNSLGSNYNLDFILESLFTGNKESNYLILKSFLEEKYGGESVLLYKGREALRLALRMIAKKDGQKGADVAISGFTCYAVYDAVVKEGYSPVYLDIDKDELNFSLQTFKKALEKNPKIKILVVQNTLGYPCEIEKIARFCKEKDIILIEDLAHAIGSIYSDGKEAGTVGDFVVLSFSQDKMIDGISGGALIVRNDKFSISNLQFPMIGFNQQKKDRLYPVYTVLIRTLYGVVLGKVLHLILKNANLLSKPMDDDGAIHSLPFWYCYVIYQQFKDLEQNISHRQKIASIYADMIDSSLLGSKGKSNFYDDIQRSSNLRFPIFVDNRQSLIAYLKRYKIFVSDIWYDAPIAPQKYFAKTNYKKGECPNSQEVSSKILNLPTHKNVTEKDAVYIAKRVNEWMGK